MATVVIISVDGRDELWIADLDNGTVVPLPEPKSGDLKVVTDLRATGTTLTKGVNIAVVVKSAEAALSGHYDG